MRILTAVFLLGTAANLPAQRLDFAALQSRCLIAFHLPDGVFTRVAIGVSRECVCTSFVPAVPALYLKLYPNSNVLLNIRN